METKSNISEQEFNRLLGESLKEDAGFTLPSNFASMVSTKISKQQALQQYLQEFLYYLAAIVGIVALAISAFLWMDKIGLPEIMEFIKQKYVLLLGINLLILFVLFADRVLLRYFHFKLNKHY